MWSGARGRWGGGEGRLTSRRERPRCAPQELSLVPGRAGPTASFSTWLPRACGRDGRAGRIPRGHGPRALGGRPSTRRGALGLGCLLTQFSFTISAAPSFTVEARGPERARGSEGHPASKATQGLQLPRARVLGTMAAMTLAAQRPSPIPQPGTEAETGSEG